MRVVLTIMTLLFSLNVFCVKEPILLLLGQQENYLHKKKITDADYKLNQQLIDLFIEFDNVTLKSKIIKEYKSIYKKDPKGLSSYILQDLISKKRKVYKVKERKIN